MFDSILIRSRAVMPDTPPVDIGALFEAMLFYGSTKLIADQGLLEHVLKVISPDQLVELISTGHLQVYFTESFTGIKTETDSAGRQYHDPVLFTSPQHTFHDVLKKVCTNISSGKVGRGRRLAHRLEPHIGVIHHDSILTKGTRESILNNDYLEKAARLVISGLVPASKVDELHFTSVDNPSGISIETNIDFIALNRMYHQSVSPKHSTITPANILSHIFGAECDIYFASSYLSEIATSSLSSSLISEKVSYVVHRRQKSQTEIADFQNIVLNNARAVREGVNSGTISIAEAIGIIKSSTKFKGWLAGVPYDAKLLAEYFSAVEKESRLDKLPGKVSRWAFFTGVGIAVDSVATGGVGTVAGLAASVLDAFFLDKLIKGWKPNQFVEEQLVPALNKKVS